MWDPRCREQHNVRFWEEILDEYGLEIGHDDRPTNHWASNGEEGQSTIDQTLATRLIT